MDQSDFDYENFEEISIMSDIIDKIEANDVWNETINEMIRRGDAVRRSDGKVIFSDQVPDFDIVEDIASYTQSDINSAEDSGKIMIYGDVNYDWETEPENMPSDYVIYGDVTEVDQKVRSEIEDELYEGKTSGGRGAIIVEEDEEEYQIYYDYDPLQFTGVNKAENFGAESKKNCGCGQDPCITYGAETFEAENKMLALENAIEDWVKNNQPKSKSAARVKARIFTYSEESDTQNPYQVRAKLFGKRYVGRTIPKEGLVISVSPARKTKALARHLGGLGLIPRKVSYLNDRGYLVIPQKFFEAETFEAPLVGAGATMDITKDSSLSSFTPEELTGSSAIHGDFDHASLNYSGHQNIEARAESHDEVCEYGNPLFVLKGHTHGYCVEPSCENSYCVTERKNEWSAESDDWRYTHDSGATVPKYYRDDEELPIYTYFLDSATAPYHLHGLDTFYMPEGKDYYWNKIKEKFMPADYRPDESEEWRDIHWQEEADWNTILNDEFVDELYETWLANHEFDAVTKVAENDPDWAIENESRLEAVGYFAESDARNAEETIALVQPNFWMNYPITGMLATIGLFAIGKTLLNSRKEEM